MDFLTTDIDIEGFSVRSIAQSASEDGVYIPKQSLQCDRTLETRGQ